MCLSILWIKMDKHEFYEKVDDIGYNPNHFQPPRVWRKIPPFSHTRLHWSRCRAMSWSLSLHPQRSSTTEMREAGKVLRCHMLRALNMCLASSSASLLLTAEIRKPQLPFGMQNKHLAVNDGSLNLNWVAGFLNHQQYWCKGSCVSKLFG